MKNIKKIIPNIVINIKDGKIGADRVFCKESAEVVNNIFRTLKGVFPAFKQAWPTEAIYKQTKSEWLKAFIDSGIRNIEQIEFGLRKMRVMKTPFVPTIGQFLEWCTPTAKELGLPSSEAAYKEACKLSKPYEKDKSWSHEAVRFAARETGSYYLNSCKEEVSRKMFNHNYCEAIKMFSQGLAFAVIPKLIEHKLHVTIDGFNFETQGTSVLPNLCFYQSLGGKLKYNEFGLLFKAEAIKQR